MIKRAAEGEKISPAVFTYKVLGPGIVFHNYLCAVCLRRPAHMDSKVGILQPCWECHKKYRLVRRTWFDRIFGW